MLELQQHFLLQILLVFMRKTECVHVHVDGEVARIGGGEARIGYGEILIGYGEAGRVLESNVFRVVL